MLGGDEEGFELAAGPVHPSIHQAPKELGESLSVAPFGGLPAGHGLIGKEQCHHATNTIQLEG